MASCQQIFSNAHAERSNSAIEVSVGPPGAPCSRHAMSLKTCAVANQTCPLCPAILSTKDKNDDNNEDDQAERATADPDEVCQDRVGNERKEREQLIINYLRKKFTDACGRPERDNLPWACTTFPDALTISEEILGSPSDQGSLLVFLYAASKKCTWDRQRAFQLQATDVPVRQMAALGKLKGENRQTKPLYAIRFCSGAACGLPLPSLHPLPTHPKPLSGGLDPGRQNVRHGINPRHVPRNGLSLIPQCRESRTNWRIDSSVNSAQVSDPSVAGMSND